MHDFLKKKFNIRLPSQDAYKKGQQIAHSITTGLQQAAIDIADYNNRKLTAKATPKLDVTYSEILVPPSEKNED